MPAVKKMSFKEVHEAGQEEEISFDEMSNWKSFLYYPNHDTRIAGQGELHRKRILVLGASRGMDVSHLTGDNDVVTLDIALNPLKIARGFGCLPMVCDISSSLPFMDNAFDIVICKHVIEHIVFPMRLIEEIKRVLKPTNEAFLFIAVPNHFSFWLRIRLLLGKGLLWKDMPVPGFDRSDHSKNHDEWNYMHLRFFTYKGFLEFMKAADLEIERSYLDLPLTTYYDFEHKIGAFKEIYRRKCIEHEPISIRTFLIYHLLFPPVSAWFRIFNRKRREWISRIRPNLLSGEFCARCTEKRR